MIEKIAQISSHKLLKSQIFFYCELCAIKIYLILKSLDKTFVPFVVNINFLILQNDVEKTATFFYDFLFGDFCISEAEFQCASGSEFLL